VKVILQVDVKALGKKGDLVEVAEGYARNFLIPRGLAKVANESNLRALRAEQSQAAAKAQRELEEAKRVAAELEKAPIAVAGKTGGAGRLFGSVTAQDIAAAVKAKTGVQLDKRKIQLDEPIKSVGRREVTVRFAPEIEATVTVVVQAEGGEEAPAEEPAASEPAAEAEAEAPGDGREAETEG